MPICADGSPLKGRLAVNVDQLSIERIAVMLDVYQSLKGAYVGSIRGLDLKALDIGEVAFRKSLEIQFASGTSFWGFLSPGGQMAFRRQSEPHFQHVWARVTKLILSISGSWWPNSSQNASAVSF